MSGRRALRSLLAVVAVAGLLAIVPGCGRLHYGDSDPVVLDCGPGGPDPALQLAYYDFEGDISNGVVDRSRDIALDTDCPTGTCPDSVAGILGRAGSFAHDRFLRAPGSGLPGGAFDDGFTVMLFFRVEASSSVAQTLFSQALRVRDANSMQLVIAPDLSAFSFITDDFDDRDILRDSTVAPLQAWAHVAMVYDRSIGRKSLVFDGVDTATKTGITVDHDDSDLLVGNDYDLDVDEYNNPFIGRIDEVRVFTAPLSPAEIDACRRRALDGGD